MSNPHRNKEEKLQNILTKVVDDKKVFGTSFALKKDDFIWQGCAGNLLPEQPYFIASTTKLFTTALILYLKSKNKLSLDDKISLYLPNDILQNLHSFKGNDYSREISVKHLLSHTSGLPDYFLKKGQGKKSLYDEIISGHDRSWTFEQAIEISKTLPPLFAPGAKNKAHYSDTNFQLLGRIIETITETSYQENCRKKIIEPLGLKQTYLYTDVSDRKPQTLYYKSKEMNRPRAMASFGCDGGMVSTSAELLVFIEAFFAGRLFPVEYIAELQVWNRVFFPMQSGIGIHLFKLPWFFNPTGAVPSFVGHSGLSGALAFYCPQKNLWIAGTVNQVAHPDISFRTMVKLTQKAL